MEVPSRSRDVAPARYPGTAISIGAPSQHPEAPSSRLTRAIHLIHPMRPPWFFPNVKTRNMTTTDKLGQEDLTLEEGHIERGRVRLLVGSIF